MPLSSPKPSFWSNLKHRVSHFARETKSNITKLNKNQILQTLVTLQDANIVTNNALNPNLPSTMTSVENMLVSKYGHVGPVSVALAGDGIAIVALGAKDENSKFQLAHVTYVNDKKPLDTNNHSNLYVICNPHFSQTGNRALTDLQACESMKALGEAVENSLALVHGSTDVNSFNGLMNINGGSLDIAATDVDALLLQNPIAAGLEVFLNDDCIDSETEARFPVGAIGYIATLPVGQQTVVLDHFLKGVLNHQIPLPINRFFKLGTVAAALKDSKIPMCANTYNALVKEVKAGMAANMMEEPAVSLGMSGDEFKNDINEFLAKEHTGPTVELNVICLKHMAAPTEGFELIKPLANTAAAQPALVAGQDVQGPAQPA